MEERGRFVGCAAILHSGTQRASIKLSDTKDLNFLLLVFSIFFNQENKTKKGSWHHLLHTPPFLGRRLFFSKIQLVSY